MTKEELEEEAEDVVYGMGYDTYKSDGHSDFAVQDILVKFAEPREKRIEELTEQNISLLTSIENLNKAVQKLEAQIEKMKCCYNCKHSRTEYEHCRTDKHEKWEIKEE